MIEEFVFKRYGKEAGIKKLAGDASERKFYRITTGRESFILMQCESSFKKDELPYINIWNFLKKHGFRIPEIHEIHPEAGILILSDCGDTLLQHAILRFMEDKNSDTIRSFCRKGIEIIVDLQLKGKQALDDSCFASRSCLDKDRFLFELDFFYDHYVKELLQLQLTEGEENELKSWFDDLAQEVSGFGRVLCHRDFHSRNLVILNDELYITDFQDARLGPYTYDLASLLRDSYVIYDEELIDEMIDFYLTRMSSEALCSMKNDEGRKRFRREFDLTCIQRNIKAIGTFAFQSQVRRNNSYLKYIPGTLNYIRRNLERLSINVPSLNLIVFKALSNQQDEMQ